MTQGNTTTTAAVVIGAGIVGAAIAPVARFGEFDYAVGTRSRRVKRELARLTTRPTAAISIQP